jgi:hypothetical protein
MSGKQTSPSLPVKTVWRGARQSLVIIRTHSEKYSYSHLCAIAKLEWQNKAIIIFISIVFDVMTSQRRHPGSKQTKQDELLSRHQRGISTDHLRRAKAVQPTLVEIRTQSFTEYINGVLLEKDEELNINNRGDVVGSSEYHATEKYAAKKSKPKKWRHGIAKITLPLGWWDESGIGKDRTARGPAVCILNQF